MKFPSDVQLKYKAGPRNLRVKNTKTAVHNYSSQHISHNTAEMLAKPVFSLVIWHTLGTVLRWAKTVAVHTCQQLSLVFFYTRFRRLEIVVIILTWLRTGGSGLWIPVKAKNVLSRHLQTCSWATQPRIRGVTLALYPRLRRPELENDRPPSPSSEIKNERDLYHNRTFINLF